MVCVHSVVVPVPLPGPAAYDVFAFFFGCDCCRSLDASVRNGKAKRVLSEPSCCDALSVRIPVLRLAQAARACYIKVPGGSSSGSSVTGEAELRGGGNPGPPGSSGGGGGGNMDLLAGRKGSGSSSVMQAPLGRLTSIDEAAALSGLHGEVAMMAPARLP